MWVNVFNLFENRQQRLDFRISKAALRSIITHLVLFVYAIILLCNICCDIWCINLYVDFSGIYVSYSLRLCLHCLVLLPILNFFDCLLTPAFKSDSDPIFAFTFGKHLSGFSSAPFCSITFTDGIKPLPDRFEIASAVNKWWKWPMLCWKLIKWSTLVS